MLIKLLVCLTETPQYSSRRLTLHLTRRSALLAAAADNMRDAAPDHPLRQTRLTQLSDDDLADVLTDYVNTNPGSTDWIIEDVDLPPLILRSLELLRFMVSFISSSDLEHEAQRRLIEIVRADAP